MICATSLEKLEQQAHEKSVEIIPYDLSGTRIKGLYCDGTIALSRELENDTKKACILAEEFGHHYTTYGDILDQANTGNRKQELRARLWAYNHQIGLRGIVDAYEARKTTPEDMADFLDVTQEFLIDALECYRSKYGLYAMLDNYMIIFDPALAVVKRIG